MQDIKSILDKFIFQAQTSDLKSSDYPKEYSDLKMKVSFGMGAPARVPWIAFIAPDMQVSKGFYPVYLYYKSFNTLILAYGVSETSEFERTWPAEVMNSAPTISSFFDKEVPRYGDSFVFKAYKVIIENNTINYSYPNGEFVSGQDLQADLQTIMDYYKKIVSIEIRKEDSIFSHGIFYLEKQLEDFIIQNWDKTELGKRFDLIVEGGELLSQQYQTDIGQIDILAKDKTTHSFVVIELKKDKSSDDTIGQITRYMGWIKEKKKDSNVKGVIIAANPDKKLYYATKVVSNIEVFLYEVDFKLKKFEEV